MPNSPSTYINRYLLRQKFRKEYFHSDCVITRIKKIFYYVNLEPYNIKHAKVACNSILSRENLVSLARPAFYIGVGKKESGILTVIFLSQPPPVLP